MFDRLIESDTSDFKPRRRYFIVSSVIVGALFVSAVIVSIYAADIGLGNDAFELSAILAPVEPPAEAPEPPQPQQTRTAEQRTSDVPTRIVNQQRIDEPPVEPPPVSVNPNFFRSRPIGDFTLSNRETDGPVPTAMPEVPAAGQQSGVSVPTNENTTKPAVEPETAPPPPPPARPKSIGVANGYATYLPKPTYPAPALAMGLTGKVDVQITIDETGKVISAKAASGHVLLRNAAENAAWKAKFTPTLLSKVPVKVTGVIVYNFTRN